MVNAPGCATFGKFMVVTLLAGLALALGLLWNHQLDGTGAQSSRAPLPTVLPTISQPMPPVSDRYFGSGSAHGVAKGDLTIDLTLPIDKDKAYVKDGLAWIAFDYPGETQAILVSLDEPENSVAISRGADTALGVDDQCDFQLTVTAAEVSGTITCPEADVIRNGQKVGIVSIDVDFTAGS